MFLRHLASLLFVFWSVLLSSVCTGTVEAATSGKGAAATSRFSGGSTPTTNSFESNNNDVSSSKSKGPIVTVPVPVVGVETVMNRRPMVDAGLRYDSNDWVITILTTPLSFILRRIRPHLLFNVAVCLAVMYWYEQNPTIAISMTGHSLLASSLGLLVSFRTNSAYSRFWEARGHWTKTKSLVRSLAVLMKSHIYPQSPKATELFLDQLSAWSSCLMHLCLGGAAKVPDHVLRFLPPMENSEKVFQVEFALPAMLLALEMQHTLHAAFSESKTSKWNLVETAEMVAASHMIQDLTHEMSSCEKILRTPVPWTYSRHTSRFLTLWLGSLPFALVGTLKHRWLVLAVCVAASYCLLGIEEIGHLIEQPFVGDPMDGRDRIWSTLDDAGEASALIKRGQITQPYDIGIPVCSLAAQIRKEVEDIAARPNVAQH